MLEKRETNMRYGYMAVFYITRIVFSLKRSSRDDPPTIYRYHNRKDRIVVASRVNLLQIPSGIWYQGFGLIRKLIHASGIKLRNSKS